MKNYLSLMSIFLRDNFSLKKMLGKSASKSKAKMILVVFAIIYVVVVFLGSFGWMFFELGKTLSSFNMTELLLLYMFTYAAGFSVMMSLLRADGFLFHFKDYDILAPLPMKPISIIAAKATIMLIMQYAMMFFIAIPIAFSYFYFTPLSFLSILYLVLGYLVIPLPLVVLSSLISMIIARITVKLKNSNLIKIILLFVVFIGIMIGSFSMSFQGENPLLGQQDFIRALGDYYLPMQWFIEAVHEKNIISLLLLLTSHIAVFAVFIVLISKASMKINAKHTVNVGRQQTKAVSKSRSVFISLLVKETRNYFGITMYVFNTLIGSIFMFLIGVASLIFKNKVIEFLGAEIGLTLPIEPMLLLIIGFCVGMVYTSAISLSIEGKKFALLKSLPIKPTTIMTAKMVFNIILALPVAILSLILLAIAFEINILTLLLMILLVSSFSLMTSTFGSILNLYLPKFDFMNEVEVIKQSVAALIAIFGSFGFLALNGLIYYLVAKVSSLEIALLAMTLANGILSFGFYQWMNKKSESLFIKMIA